MLTLLLITIPLVAALAIMLLGAKLARPLALAAGIAELVVALAATYFIGKPDAAAWLTFNQSWIGPLGISFGFNLDGISAVMVLLSALLFAFCIAVAHYRLCFFQ